MLHCESIQLVRSMKLPHVISKPELIGSLPKNSRRNRIHKRSQRISICFRTKMNAGEKSRLSDCIERLETSLAIEREAFAFRKPEQSSCPLAQLDFFLSDLATNSVASDIWDRFFFFAALREAARLPPRIERADFFVLGDAREGPREVAALEIAYVPLLARNSKTKSTLRFERNRIQNYGNLGWKYGFRPYCRSQKMLKNEAERFNVTCKVGFNTVEKEPSKVML